MRRNSSISTAFSRGICASLMNSPTESVATGRKCIRAQDGRLVSGFYRGLDADQEPPQLAREPVPQALAFPKANRVVPQLQHAHRRSLPMIAVRWSTCKRGHVDLSQHDGPAIRQELMLWRHDAQR